MHKMTNTIHLQAFNAIISDNDLQELTGYSTPSKQCDVLRAHGVFFITRRDGRPRTTWEHFNNPLSHRNTELTSKEIEPNFAALS